MLRTTYALLSVLAVAAGAPAADPTPGRRHVVLINVTRYPASPLLPQLRATQREAEGLVTRLTTRPAERTTVVRLTDESGVKDATAPTAANIRSVLTKLAAAVEPDDEVFVLAAGVGFEARTGAAFAPGDADLARPETLLLVAEMADLVKGLNCRRRLLMFDACRQPIDVTVPRTERGAPPAADSSTRPTALTRPGTFAVIQASSAHQLAYNCKQSGLGLLFCQAVTGLAGEADVNRDGTVTVAELAAFIRASVPVAAREVHQSAQHPEITVTASEVEDWAVCPCPKPSARPDQTASAPATSNPGGWNTSPVASPAVPTRTAPAVATYDAPTNPSYSADPRVVRSVPQATAQQRDYPLVRQAARAGIAYGLSRIR